MEINKERLRELRRVVENAPEDRFEMKQFCTSKNSGCGTAYCAAGWAALDPWFQENTEILDIFGVEVKDDLAYVNERDYMLTFDRLEGMFGISTRDTTNLFGGNLRPGSKTVPKSMVLENIDLLLAGESAEKYLVGMSYDDFDDEDDD